MNGHTEVEKDTAILPVDPAVIGLRTVPSGSSRSPLLDGWTLQIVPDTETADNIKVAAYALQRLDVPVAFPTETVYGLGADATRSNAVKGIYSAKGRPSDNPLIVHVHSLEQVRCLLRGHAQSSSNLDPIPPIYRPLIDRFWPGPLTLLMPKPKQSQLAPEVTAGLDTFGVRMPSSVVALALIKQADVPIAAPSANASTKPSPTAAEHVKHDLDGRIDYILDGGPCEVGVESTVVDGLCDPPLILRPGGVSLEELQSCPGWENVQIGYKDASEVGAKPKAPGMKYRHYSPAAAVTLYESGAGNPPSESIKDFVRQGNSIGIVRTGCWPLACGCVVSNHALAKDSATQTPASMASKTQILYGSVPKPVSLVLEDTLGPSESPRLFDVALGSDAKGIARGLFSALRELDLKDVDMILVEGIDDEAGEAAAAVMNRLRKASRTVVRAGEEPTHLDKQV